MRSIQSATPSVRALVPRPSSTNRTRRFFAQVMLALLLIVGGAWSQNAWAIIGSCNLQSDSTNGQSGVVSTNLTVSFGITDAFNCDAGGGTTGTITLSGGATFVSVGSGSGVTITSSTTATYSNLTGSGYSFVIQLGASAGANTVQWTCSSSCATSSFMTYTETATAGTPSMTNTKVLAGNSDPDNTGNVTPGDVLTFTSTAVNDGTVPLTTVTVSDPKITPSTTTCATLAVGASCILTGTYTVTAADAGAGTFSNTSQATSIETTSNFHNSTVNTPVFASPTMSVAKTLTNNADGDGSGTVTQGDVLTFTVTAKNTSPYSLTNVVVSDPLTAPSGANCPSVAPGGTCVLVGTYTVGSGDVATGSISNTGSATSDQITTPVTSTLSTPVLGSPKLTISKTLTNNADGDGSGTVTQGDVLTFRVRVINTGNVPLTNVQVTDPLTSPNSNTCANVPNTGLCDLTGTYTVTAADVAAGSISNTGSVTTTEIPGPTTSNLVTPVLGSPALTVTKTLTNNADGDGSGTVTQGDVLTFRVRVANTGNIPLTNVQISDPLTSPSTATCASVAVGANCNLVGTYTVTAADVTAGSISNTGSATSNEVPGPTTKTLSTPVVGSPAMGVAKILANNADGDGSGTVTQGDVLTFRVTMTNTGNIPLTNVNVSDPLTSPNTVNCASVAVGATCVLNGTYTVTAADVTAGSISNTGSATSTQVPGPVNSSLSTPVLGSPAMGVAKILANNADGDGSGTVTQGDVLTFRVTMTNTGNIPLTNVNVSDPLTSPNTVNCASVAVGATCVLNGTYTVTAADVTAGSISNTGSATSTQVPGPVSSSLSTPVVGSPAMTVLKTLASNADNDGSGTVTQGDVLTYRVTVKNTGNIALTNVNVSDPLTSPNTVNCANVAVGATCILNGTYTVTAADVTAGSISNTGSATSNQVPGPVNNTLNTPVVGSPAMTITKALTNNADNDGSGNVSQGDVLTFRVRVNNTGNVALTNVQVSDPLTAPNSVTCASVAVGGSCILNGTYTVTNADVTTGSISNTGSATSTQVPGPITANLTTAVTGSPKMTIAKALTNNADGDGSGTVTQGDVLTFGVRVDNTGNVPLTNVTVTDPLTTPNSITCATLAVGASCHLLGTYTVTAADVTAGSISNTGSGTSTQVPGPITANLNTPVFGSPAMTIAKALVGNTDPDGSGTVTQGDVLTFRVTVKNTGNIPLTNVNVSDPLTTPNARNCASVAVGATCVLNGTYTVTAADVTAGSIANTGSATSDQVAGPITSSLSTTVVGSPAMTVAKILANNADGDGSGTVTQGDVLTFRVTMTNSGNIPLTNVNVNDPLTSPNTVNCASVAVGATCVLNGTYTVTAADVTAGSINNTGSATSTQVPGPVNSSLNTPVAATPKMTVAKVLANNADGDGSGTVTQGDVLTYRVTMTNTGNIALTNVTVSDALTTPSSTNCASVAVGATCVLNGTYTVSNADVTAGSISNTGSATSNQVPGPVNANLNTPVVGSPAMTVAKTLANNADGDGSGTVTAGDVLTFRVTMTNTGNIPLTNVTVNDPLTSPNTTNCANVAVGATCVLNGTYTVTNADVTAGSISNTGSATSTQVPGPVNNTLVTAVVGSPKMSVAKVLSNNADGDGSGTVTQGDVLTYTVTMTNTGNIPLTNVTVRDALTTPNAVNCASVAVGATCVLSGTYTVTATDVRTGAINNTGSATSNETGRGPVTVSLSTPVNPTYSMSVSKVLSNNADGDGSGTVTQGDVLTYTVTMTNTGNATQNSVTVSDALTTPNAASCATVAAGATCVLNGTYTVTAADVKVGAIRNTGSAISKQVFTPVTANLSTPVNGTPKMTVVKVLASNADGDHSGTVTQGDVLTYTVTATNTGNIPLTNLVVDDPITTPNTTTCANVAVGATCVLSGTYTVAQADVNAKSISNTGSATSNEIRAAVSSTVNTAVLPSPAISLVKVLANNADGDGSGNVSPGDVLTYTVTATNSGNIALTNVKVDDALTTPNTTTCTNVAIGATCVLTGTYTVTPQDANKGSIINNGSATATQIGAPARTSLTTPVAAGTPALTVTKALTANADGDGSGTVTQGDVLTFTVTATNSGNIPLGNVHVTDPLTSPSQTNCASLAVGASCTLTGTYTVKAADVTAGAVNNTGSATANQVTTPVTASLSTPVVGSPAMTVSKVLSGNTDGDGSGSVTPGDSLTYTVTATNTGNVPLANVTVSDPLTAPASTSCASVAVGSSCVLTGTYTVTAADAANGSIANTGSATSTQVPGPVTSSLNTPVATLVRTIAIAGGDNQSGNPGVTLPVPLGVLVQNSGHAAAGVTINWAVASGTATLGSASSISNASGQATNTVTLGATSGPVTITATRADDATKSVTFHETINVLGPPVLTRASGDNQVGVVNADAAQPMVVHLVDGAGVPFANQAVNWQVTSGAATLASTSSMTDASGNAQMPFVYGPTAGAVTIRASFGTSTVDFSETAKSYVVTIVSGNNQAGTAGQALAQPFQVVVSFPPGLTTMGTNPHTHAPPTLAGLAIQWNVTAGGGTLSNGASTVTDATGHASNLYTLGTTPGLNQVQVVVPGGNSTTFSANASAANASLLIVSGNNQSLTTNTASAPMVVQLLSNGVPVANATINWTAANATLASATSVTDGTGHASNTAKVTSIGAATVSASSAVPAAGPVTFGLNGGIATIPGLTPQQGQIAGAIDNTCAALAKLATLSPAQRDMLAQCNALSWSAGSDPDQAINAINELFSNVAFLQTSAALLISNAQFDNIKARIAALRSGTGGDHFGGLAFSSPSGTLPVGSIGNTMLGFNDKEKKDDAKEAGSGFSRWGYFMSGTFSSGSADPRNQLPGYGFHTDGITGGVDYRFSDKLIFGVGAGYAKYDANLNAGQGAMNTTGWSLSAYSTYFRKSNWYVDGVLSYGSNSYDLSRRILYTLTTPTGSTTVDQTATATDNGTTLSAAVTFGRDFNKGPWSFGPYFRGTWTKVDFDAYQEKLDPNATGNGLGLDVQTHSLKSVASVLGAKVNYASSQSWGIFMPHAEVEWEHEFHDNPDSVTARFLQDPTQTPITVSGFPVDTDFFRLGVGASFVFPHGRSGFIYYEKTLGRSGVTQDNIALGLRIEF